MKLEDQSRHSACTTTNSVYMHSIANTTCHKHLPCFLLGFPSNQSAPCSTTTNALSIVIAQACMYTKCSLASTISCSSSKTMIEHGYCEAAGTTVILEALSEMAPWTLGLVQTSSATLKLYLRSQIPDRVQFLLPFNKLS
ncbi:hypothetical protein Mapa_007303 [Marchantia paleacea]|nr:hypothetical protein Mapa_007303 [Marchantia paleacea]